MISIGRKIRSKWDSKIVGYVVGYGTIQWPTSDNISGDEQGKLVYLVQLEGVEGSRHGEVACRTLRADRVEEV